MPPGHEPPVMLEWISEWPVCTTGSHRVDMWSPGQTNGADMGAAGLEPALIQPTSNQQHVQLKNTYTMYMDGKCSPFNPLPARHTDGGYRRTSRGKKWQRMVNTAFAPACIVMVAHCAYVELKHMRTRSLGSCSSCFTSFQSRGLV